MLSLGMNEYDVRVPPTEKVAQTPGAAQPEAFAGKSGNLEWRYSAIGRVLFLSANSRCNLRHPGGGLLDVALRLSQKGDIVPAGRETARCHSECACRARPFASAMEEENAHLYRG